MGRFQHIAGHLMASAIHLCQQLTSGRTPQKCLDYFGGASLLFVAQSRRHGNKTVYHGASLRDREISVWQANLAYALLLMPCDRIAISRSGVCRQVAAEGVLSPPPG
jgi:hypothetical protein